MNKVWKLSILTIRTIFSRSAFQDVEYQEKQSIFFPVALYGYETDSTLPCAGKINGAVWEQNAK
jgi:hypothetical protein